MGKNRAHRQSGMRRSALRLMAAAPRLLAAALAAVLLAGCSLPALEWMPQAPQTAPAGEDPAAPAPEAPAAPLVVLLGEDTDMQGSFSALLDAYAASQGAEVRLLQPGDADAGGAGLRLLARRPEPLEYLDLSSEPLLGVLAQSAAALPGLSVPDPQTGCPALPLGFAGYGYLADGALLTALLGESFDPALLARAGWDEWADFIETLGGWVDSPAEETVTLAGQSFALPAEKPAAAQNLAGVFAPPAGSPGYAGSAFSPAFCAAFAEGDILSADPERLAGPLNGVWEAFQLEQTWAAAPFGPPSVALGGESPEDGASGDEGTGQTAENQAAPETPTALLEGGRAVFCRAATGGLNGGCGAEFLSRLVLIPFKTALEESDLAPEAGYSLEALNSWPVAGTPGWLAIPANAGPEQQALAEGFLLWLFASPEGQRALQESMGALSIAGNSEPQSPAMQAVSDALHTGQALPDLSQGFSPQAHARASGAFVETAGASTSTARSEWADAVLQALAGGE